MNRSKWDVWVGLFVLLGAAAFLFLALKAANLVSWTAKETYRVQGQFDNIGGLKAGAPVKSAGVNVGRVESIRFNSKSYKADVVVVMEKEYPFPSDSSLKILTSGILGEQYLGVEAGVESDNWTDGAKVLQTSSALVLEELISRFLYSKAADSGKPAADSAPQ